MNVGGASCACVGEDSEALGSSKPTWCWEQEEEDGGQASVCAKRRVLKGMCHKMVVGGLQ